MADIKRYFRTAIFLLSFLFPFSFFLLTSAFAESLSDMNMKQFTERAVPQVKTGENPFVRQNITPQDMLVEDLTLTGIIYEPRDAYALISGFVVKEGEDIAGFKVKLIEKDRVILRQMDQVKVLRLE